MKELPLAKALTHCRPKRNGLLSIRIRHPDFIQPRFRRGRRVPSLRSFHTFLVKPNHRMNPPVRPAGYPERYTEGGHGTDT